MKKLIGIFMIIMLLLSVGLFTREVLATQIEQCNQETTYTKSSDFDDGRVNINFQDGDEAVTITVKTGYQLVSVEMDIDDDGQGGYVNHTGNVTSGVKYNPNGDDINSVKVKVKKVCQEVCNDDSALNYQAVVAGQTTANNNLCEYPEEPEYCEDETALNYKEEGECEYPEETPTPTPTPETKVESSSSVSTPVCTDGNTLNLPANFHVVRNGSQATVNFFITEGDSANIYYKVNESSTWQYSLIGVKPGADNFVSVTINDLDPNLGYTFGAQQVKGCGSGELVTAVVIDPPAQGEIFRFSFWTW